jgi:hypothetical protein
MNSSFHFDHAANYKRFHGPPTAVDVWLPYGDGHRIIFRADGSCNVWDNYRFQQYGEWLFQRVEAHFQAARNQPDGDLMAAAGWDSISPGKIVGMLLEALDVAEANAAYLDDRVLVPLLVAACEAISPI